MSVNLAPTSDQHTYLRMYTMHPVAEFSAIYTVSCREIILTGCFCATVYGAQEADYESES